MPTREERDVVAPENEGEKGERRDPFAHQAEITRTYL